MGKGGDDAAKEAIRFTIRPGGEIKRIGHASIAAIAE